MIVEKLKASILQKAFEGKITSTLSSDKLVSESIKDIEKQKLDLINKYNARKEPEYKPVNDDEILFEIPDTWAWCRIGQLGVFKKGPFGSALTKSIFVKKGNDTIKVYEQKNAIKKDIELGDYYITNEYYENKMKSFEVFAGDIIVSCAGTIGETFVIPDIFEKGIINQALMRMTMVEELNKEYFLLYFDFILKKLSNQLSNGSAIKNIPPFEVFKQLVIPIPPKEEQQRIVNKVNEITKKLDELNKIENALNILKEKFPEDIKYSILDSAIKGNLSIRKYEEQVAEVVEMCEFDDVFDIPENWKWTKLENVLTIDTGLSFKKTEQCIASNDALRILRGGNIDNNYQYLLKPDDIYVARTDKYIKLLEGDVITPSVTSMEQMGKTAYIDKNLEMITAGGFVFIIRMIDKNILDPKYAMYFINSKFHKNMCKPNINKSGQAFYNLKKTGLLKQPIAIPPIEEQKRIVSKIEEILPIIESINSMY